MNLRTSQICATFAFLAFLVTCRGEDKDNEANDSSTGDPTVVLLFMFFGLCLGILTMQVLSRVGEAIPYTVVIFVLGILFSFFAKPNETGTFGQSIRQWVGIDAELLLFVFLPPLIFGEAMNLNWHHVQGGFYQSTLLAGPGVVLGAAMMGVLVKYLLPYNWSWTLSMVFGSILSATDPVAVVALLKRAGASPKLTILIVGESLMNDGTAMVLFTLFYNMLLGETYDFAKILSFFVSATLGSSLFGVACGLIIVRWLRSANRPLKEADITIQMAITICCAYLIFFAAQYSMKISGVLACCGAGLMIAWLGPPIILSHETMHNVWGFIEWMGNTLIFLLAGLIIGHRSLQTVSAKDWGYVVLLYLLLMLVRFLVIAMLFPFIRDTGHKCTFHEAVFMGWAGLRGALAMALALIVETTYKTPETSRIFFYCGGIAALTLIINASFARHALDYLHLIDDNTMEKELVISQIKKRLRKKMNKYLEQMKGELSARDVEEVRMSVSILKDPQIEDLYRDTEDSGGEGRHSNNSARSKSRTFSEVKVDDTARLDRVSRLLHTGNRGPNAGIIPDLLSYVRAIFLEIVRVKYWHLIEAGKLPRLSHSAQFLLYSVDVALDASRDPQGLQDWACIETEITTTPLSIRVLAFLDTHLPHMHCTGFITKLLGRLEARREKRAVYILTSFIEAHEHGQKRIHAFVGAPDEDDDESHNMSTPEEVRVKNESSAAIARARDLLGNIEVDTLAAIKSKQAARTVLAKQAEMVKNMVTEGLLTSKHAEEFLEEISVDAAKIESERNQMYREHADKSAQRRHANKYSLLSSSSYSYRPSDTSDLLVNETD